MNINNIDIKNLEELHVAAVAHIGTYHQIGKAFETLAAWAVPQGLMVNQPCMLAIYHDDPSKIPAEQLRSDACLVVPSTTEINGNVRPYTVSGGKYLVVNAQLTMSEFGDVWCKVYKIAEEKGLKCDDRDHYELYLNNPGESPDALFLIDICIPVK